MLKDILLLTLGPNSSPTRHDRDVPGALNPNLTDNLVVSAYSQ